jgi:putative transposase
VDRLASVVRRPGIGLEAETTRHSGLDSGSWPSNIRATAIQRCTACFRLEGLATNPQRTYRLYREEGLQVRTKRRKKLIRPRIPMAVPDCAHKRWSMDIVSDQLANGRRLRVLNVVDDFTRECVLQVVDFSISGERVARAFDQLSASRPLPTVIVCDNGPEFTSKAMFFWARTQGVRLHFIQPSRKLPRW